jgi:hypothetical protein
MRAKLTCGAHTAFLGDARLIHGNQDVLHLMPGICMGMMSTGDSFTAGGFTNFLEGVKSRSEKYTYA